MLTFGDLTLEPETAELSSSNATVRLPPGKLGVIGGLMKAQGRVVPHEILINIIWAGRGDGPYDDIVRVTMYRLRHILADIHSTTSINNRWGIGFYLSFAGTPIVTCRFTPQEYRELEPYITQIKSRELVHA
jgi:DNA-binding response OmpR family regulator